MFLLKRFCSGFQRINGVTKTAKLGDRLNVQGWVQNIRRLKKNIFFDLSDGSTVQRFQVVIPKEADAKDISVGSSVSVNGIIQTAPNGQPELHAKHVKVIADGNIADGYPFTPKQQHPPEYVREHLHLRARVDYIGAQMRVRHRALKAIHDYMDASDFIQINTPVLTTNDCEGAGEVFRVQPDSAALLKEMARPNIPAEQSYFDDKVFLSVSGQLHLEAMSYGLGNTYTLAPAFRSENSKSPLHLAEFYMFEAELAFIEEISALITFIEKMLKAVTAHVIESASKDIRFCQERSLGYAFQLSWLNSTWTTVSYDDALEILVANKHIFKTEIKLAEGFSKEQELFLVEHCGTPVFVIDWPTSQKPFYMKAVRTNPERVHALDLLMPGVGELCGGGIRESDANILRAHPQLPNGLEWYLELRKFGGIPTGGFGMGFERYLQLITGVKNIRDVIPFPRYPHSCLM
ncbi:PREDICTED: probable asparagine--tRNA ligase, mitochondrial [Rhagoletis zephyria]|uniref:probable asparagine--tRNA ligase, mitochondrial n=1 Tax=Rhagoletis zephyria TaxID=28612 RepID=UPI0008117799|nr:PREDICTED: probable asparagine--tRNA ligase, mitochondrial [Rhagoletis zephyria]